ncbi:hypothetical protein DEO72_LG6g725 [Vigna unguiculata]|uniref:Uncharacterized protein n=1 Tax=Vigna unguiculata TaxID=3917 RepID=A0A4D6M5J3_VIGUN|nr:hypothetical protein DEO72_LG6g725 [Vigna unguiculata]
MHGQPKWLDGVAVTGVEGKPRCMGSQGYGVAAVAAETPKGLIPRLWQKNGGGFTFQRRGGGRSAGCLGVAVVVRCLSDDGAVVDDEIATVVARGEEANYSEALWLLQAASGAAMVDDVEHGNCGAEEGGGGCETYGEDAAIADHWCSNSDKVSDEGATGDDFPACAVVAKRGVAVVECDGCGVGCNSDKVSGEGATGDDFPACAVVAKRGVAVVECDGCGVGWCERERRRDEG